MMKNFFAREVLIRLSEDGENFVCTTKYGKFFSRAREVALHCQPAAEAVDEKSFVPVKKRFSYWASEELSDEQ